MNVGYSLFILQTDTKSQIGLSRLRIEIAFCRNVLERNSELHLDNWVLTAEEEPCTILKTSVYDYTF